MSAFNTLSGKIAREEDSMEYALAGATIEINGGSTTGSEVSDSNGKYAFYDLPDNTYTVTVSKDGYETVEETVTLDGPKTCNVLLLTVSEEPVAMAIGTPK